MLLWSRLWNLAKEEFRPNDPLAATFLENLAGLGRSLAERGEFESQQSLGAMYFTGIGVPQDYGDAAFSAAKGSPFAAASS